MARHAREARIALLRQEAVIDQLQIHRAADQAAAPPAAAAEQQPQRSANE